ncbi:MAG: [FeFe] hydrogenase H-cluster radical SAM maturase HydE [Syntrophobacteraceae bacterium]|jgi:biotin synthase
MEAEKMDFIEALSAGVDRRRPAVEWLVPLLESGGEQERLLLRTADRFRAETMGEAVHLRGIIEFSNYCRKNCGYCGLRRDNRKLARYRLTREEIVEAAIKAWQIGYKTIVLQSGEDLYFSTELAADIIGEIKSRTGLAITLSLGERDGSAYSAWRKAGADRYLLRIETTDEALFKELHPDDDLNERKRCLFELKELGYQLGSGVMVGLPGQGALSLAKDVIWLRGLGAEMIGVGPFIPHPGTPLKNEKGGTLEQALRLVAVLRLVFPYAHIPATTAMGSLDPVGREKALQAGANVMMPNITPAKVRPLYELYPNKICLDENADRCFACVASRIFALNRTIGAGPGHVIRDLYV